MIPLGEHRRAVLPPFRENASYLVCVGDQGGEPVHLELLDDVRGGVQAAGRTATDGPILVAGRVLAKLGPGEAAVHEVLIKRYVRADNSVLVEAHAPWAQELAFAVFLHGVGEYLCRAFARVAHLEDPEEFPVAVHKGPFEGSIGLLQVLQGDRRQTVVEARRHVAATKVDPSQMILVISSLHPAARRSSARTTGCHAGGSTLMARSS